MVTKWWKMLLMSPVDQDVIKTNTSMKFTYSIKDTTGTMIAPYYSIPIFVIDEIICNNQKNLFNAFSNSVDYSSPHYQVSMLHNSGIPQNREGGCVFFSFGTGTSKENSEQYCLDVPISSAKLTVSNISYRMESEENSDTIKAIFTCSVSAVEDITIKEIGIFKTVLTSYPSSTGASYTAQMFRNIMVARNVLDTPIEIKAGEMKTVNFAIAI